MVDEPQLSLDRSGPLFEANAGLQNKLRRFFPEKTFAHHVVPARFTKGTWARLSERTPFVAFGFTGLRPSRDNASAYHAQALFTVFVGIKQQMIDKMFVGDARMPGLLGMMGMLVATLHGAREGHVGTWMCGAAENLYDEGWANDDMGVVGVEVSINLEVCDARAREALPALLAVGSVWHLPEMPEQITYLGRA